jgi:hypothetical protein
LQKNEKIEKRDELQNGQNEKKNFKKNWSKCKIEINAKKHNLPLRSCGTKHSLGIEAKMLNFYLLLNLMSYLAMSTFFFSPLTITFVLI